MLRYSYKTEIARLETTLLQSQMLEIKYPNNPRHKEVSNKIKKEIEWFKDRKDPGAIIL